MLVYSENGALHALNATNVQAGHEHPIELKVLDPSEVGSMKGYKSQSGHLFTLASESKVMVYEIIMSYQGLYGAFDLGNMRIIL